MKFTVTSFIVVLAIANAFVLATCQSYSCSGSILCRGLAQSDCHAAERQIQPGYSYFTFSEIISRNKTITECLLLPEISGYSYDNLLHCVVQRETLARVVEEKKRLAGTQ
jgi:hypothetical protein